MKIAWKVALATLSILVVFFGAGSSLLVSLAFRSSLTRAMTPRTISMAPRGHKKRQKAR